MSRYARGLLKSLKSSLRPIQRRVLFPIRNHLRLRAWQTTRCGPVIINYHGVEDEIADAKVQPYALTSNEFRTSLRVLGENHEVVTLDRLVEALEAGESPPSRWAVLTFDDGYANTLTTARPILREFGDLPATVFVCPGLIGERSWLPDQRIRLAVHHFPGAVLELPSIGQRVELGPRGSREQNFSDLIRRIKHVTWPLRLQAAKEAVAALPDELRNSLEHKFKSEELVNWEQLQVLSAEPGITIGAHTMHHIILHADQPRHEIDKEVAECRLVLRERIGCEPRHLAYPGGMFCPAAREAVQSAGYCSALTIVPGEVSLQSDRFLLPRLTGSPHEVVMRRQLACAAMKGGQGWWF